MAEPTLLLPRIRNSYRNIWDPSSLFIEGQSQHSERGLFTDSRNYGNGGKLLASGHIKTRAVTARSYNVHSNLCAPEQRGKNRKNIRAQTAGGSLSVDVSLTQNYSVDEIYAVIREKLSNSQSYVQQMFRNNDPKGHGVISREALTRILWKICGFLTTQQINNLLIRLKLSKCAQIAFNDFKSCFQNDKVHNTEWLNLSTAKHLEKCTEKGKVIPNNEDRTPSENTQSFLLDQVTKSESFHKYLLSSCLRASGMVNFQQFTEALKSVGLELSDDQIADIWTSTGNRVNSAVPADLLFSKMGIPFPVDKAGSALNRHRCRKTEDIIVAIKEKLNGACSSMLQEFSKINTSETGLISRSAFRTVLTNLNVPMSAVDMEHLLARFNLRRKDGMVDYSTFVNKLKSRSYLSFMKRMMDNFEQRQNHGRGPLKHLTESLSALEAEQQLFLMCQGLFVQLIGQFQKADVGNGFVYLEDFKNIIKKTIEIQLTSDEVENLAMILGDKDLSNSLSYRKFIALIQDRPTSYELTEEVERLSFLVKVHHRADKIRYKKTLEMDLSRYTHAQVLRPLQELQSIVWDLLQNRFWNFCKVFISICRNDDCSADKEKLDAVFVRMNILLLPEELENLWHNLPISSPVESISLRKLLSYFVSMKKPKNLGSKKASPVENIQNKIAKDIIKYWSEIKTIMKNRDPSGTGCVSFTEICAVFQALKLSVSPMEFDALCQAFDLNQDGNFHYIPFLKFYVRKNKT